jgi:FkbM family methyltransferase
MKITYLDDYHFINESILTESPILVKVGVVGFDDLAKFKTIYPKSKIIAYEADLNNYNYSIKNERKDGFRPDLFINCAVGDCGRIELYRFKNYLGNSIYPRHTYDKNCTYVDTIGVRCVNLQQVFERIYVNYIDVLILNCEGGELAIMRQMKDETIRNKIGQICVSFHDPRIYPIIERKRIIDLIGNYYHIMRGVNKIGGIPDYLFIRKV